MIKEKPIKKWLGKVNNCDICGRYLPGMKFFYDANVQGTWGLICPVCFKNYGCKLGTGLGQKYDSKTKIKLDG